MRLLERLLGNEATWVKTPEEAEQILRAEVRPATLLLFKSSNGAKLGILVTRLLSPSTPSSAEEEAAPTQAFCR